ncbi:hypothetical protein JKP88DRAFT_168872, partial [Tribonema minus]
EKNETIVCREIGGVMARMWPAYLHRCHALVFVIDASSVSNADGASAALHALIAHDHLQQKPVIVCLNKVGTTTQADLATLQELLHIDDLVDNWKAGFTLCHTDAASGAGVARVLQLARALHRDPQTSKALAATATFTP